MIVGAPWQPDWRNVGQSESFANELGFGDDVAFCTLSNPTSWGAHAGLVVSHALIPGYGDPGSMQLETMGEARMGSLLPWPTHGQQREIPNVALLELAEEAGFDVGGQLPASFFPRMVFADPPSFSEQTTPIPAFGV